MRKKKILKLYELNKSLPFLKSSSLAYPQINSWRINNNQLEAMNPIKIFSLDSSPTLRVDIIHIKESTHYGK